MDLAERRFAAIRKDFGTPAIDFAGPIPFPVLQSLFDPLMPPGLRWYWKADFFKDFSEDAIALHLKHGSALPTPLSTMHIYPINGACNRVPSDATAFAYRDAKFATVIAGMWPDAADNEKNVKWVKDYYKALEPHSAAGGYVNFMAEDDQGRIRDNYKDNYSRLASIKQQYDPGNLFHMNQNIKPAG